MNAKSTFKKIVFVAIWICIGGTMVSLLLAAISKENKGACKDYVISFRKGIDPVFINTQEVERLLLRAEKGSVKGRAISSFDLRKLEMQLEQNSWIDDAELYFDSGDILHITVSEKQPVARIFDETGSSFFIDHLGRSIPLSDQSVANIPVFTSFPSKKLSGKAQRDLLHEIRTIANYIYRDSFWMAQVAQIDITPEQTFEMVPVVGNHLVQLGSAEQIEAKFNRLYVFYRSVLSKTGFTAYKNIDVKYKGQVVVSQSDEKANVDATQLRKNVAQLLKQSEALDPDQKSTREENEKKKTPKALMPAQVHEDPDRGYN